jgi:hypothetical protein
MSATHLVRLALRNIPRSRYISPEVILASLAVLANLKSLTIELKHLRHDRHPPLPTRTVLPALTYLEFLGPSKYLEDLVARIDAPLLDSLCITFYYEVIFDIPQLAQFMRRTTRFQALKEAHVNLDFPGVRVESSPPSRTSNENPGLRISCEDLYWQLPFLVHVFRSLFPSIYTVEHLYIHGPRYVLSQWEDDNENLQWLQIFDPFTSVKNLYIIKEFAECISPALRELDGEGVIDVLPALESLFLEKLRPRRRWGHVREGLQQFVSARQLLGHPVAISHWNWK